MKYKIFDENKPIIIEKVLRTFSFPFNFHDGCTTSERVMVDTIVYTDGKIKQLNHSKTQNIIACNVNGKPYKPSVDTYNVNELYLEDASYVVKIIKSLDFYRTPRGGGNRFVVRNVEILVKNPKDKVTLKEIKDILKSNDIYMSINDSLVSTSKRGITVIGYSQINENVKLLSKKKK